MGKCNFEVGKMKVALVQEKLPAYREKLFIDLQKELNIDFFASTDNAPGLHYSRISVFKFLTVRISILPISIISYNRIILEANIRDLTVVMLSLLFPSKVVLWGNWKTGRVTDIFRVFLSKWCSRSIYYSDHHQMQFDPFQKRSVVANNTIAISAGGFKKVASDFVIGFLGSVNKRKGLEDLLKLLNDLIDSGYKVDLNIIGDGDYLDKLMELALYKQNSVRIHLLGRVEDENELSRLIQNCSVIVSPKQAGLSIAHTFACGRPFICYENAISGGEKYNIINGINGFRSTDYYELKSHVIYLLESKKLLLTMCHNSKKYYESNMSADNFIKNVKLILR